MSTYTTMGGPAVSAIGLSMVVWPMSPIRLCSYDRGGEPANLCLGIGWGAFSYRPRRAQAISALKQSRLGHLTQAVLST